MNIKTVPVPSIKIHAASTSMSPPILNLTTWWNYVISWRLGCFNPRQKTTNTHRTGGCVRLRVGLDDLQRAISCLCTEMNPGQSSPQPNHYTNWAHLIPKLSTVTQRNTNCLTWSLETPLLIKECFLLPFPLRWQLYFLRIGVTCFNGEDFLEETFAATLKSKAFADRCLWPSFSCCISRLEQLCVTRGDSGDVGDTRFCGGLDSDDTSIADTSWSSLYGVEIKGILGNMSDATFMITIQFQNTRHF